mgnify:FL=1
MKSSAELRPLLKYPGGKTSELPIILKYIPANITKYIEPFLGGGAVYFAINAAEYYVNDKSEDLMFLYKYIKNKDVDFFNELEMINSNWKLLSGISKDGFERFANILLRYKNDEIEKDKIIDIVSEMVNEFENIDGPLFQLENIQQPIFKKQLRKNIVSIIKRICKNEKTKERELSEEELKDNFECSIKSAYYMYFRELYNYPEKYTLSKPRTVAIFLFIREYCYSSMFRFNTKGKFNVPYGGISYNKKSLTSKIEYYKSEELLDFFARTSFSTNDFQTFLNDLNLSENDFMFLDPPYDTTFSEYDKNSFDQDDQIRLAQYLINDCNCKFMLVIKKTEFIENLYKDKGLQIIEFDKNYFVSFKNRNKKNVKHLLIKNY